MGLSTYHDLVRVSRTWAVLSEHHQRVPTDVDDTLWAERECTVRAWRFSTNYDSASVTTFVYTVHAGKISKHEVEPMRTMHPTVIIPSFPNVSNVFHIGA